MASSGGVARVFLLLLMLLLALLIAYMICFHQRRQIYMWRFPPRLCPSCICACSEYDHRKAPGRLWSSLHFSFGFMSLNQPWTSCGVVVSAHRSSAQKRMSECLDGLIHLPAASLQPPGHQGRPLLCFFQGIFYPKLLLWNKTFLYSIPWASW